LFSHCSISTKKLFLHLSGLPEKQEKQRGMTKTTLEREREREREREAIEKETKRKRDRDEIE